MESFITPLLPFITIFLVDKIGGSLDLTLLVAFKAYSQWDSVHQFVSATVNPSFVIEVAKHVSALFAILQFTRFLRGLLRSDVSDIGSRLDSFPVKPLFFPCQTSHVRMFPKKHGFSYSYLFVGIPIGWKGNSGGMLSAEEGGIHSWYQRWLTLTPGKAWWTVNGDDYLKRGHKGGLLGKLREYLESQVCMSLCPITIQTNTHRVLTTSNTHMPISSPPPNFSTMLRIQSPSGISTQPRRN